MRSANELQAELDVAADTLTDPRERELLSQLEMEFDAFMDLDSVAWRKLQAGREDEVRDIFLGPELERFEAMAATAERVTRWFGRRPSSANAALPLDRHAGDVVGCHEQDDDRHAGRRGRAQRRQAGGGPRPAVVTRDVLLTLSLLLGAALAARFLASLVRVPEILFLVLFGALLGPSLLDVVDVPLDAIGAQLLFTLGVSLILFYGGLNLSLDILRRVWVGLGLLVVPGVILTTLITGAAAYLAFDLSWEAALLMGAVLSPTDPAILIPLFVRSRLRPKVAQTVVAESAFNDPTAAVLALALAGVLLSGDASLATPAREFVVDLGISTVIGIVAGVLLAATISSRRAGIWRESSAAAVLAVVTIGYFSLDSAGGSGYLGAFLAGLIVGNMERLGLAMHSTHKRDLRQFAFNMADLVTLFVFVVLGANIPFETLGEFFLPALAVLATLLLVARPLTVLASTLPDRGGGWTRPEVIFLCWTRETGVVPAALVGVLAGLGVPDIEVYASVVALAVVMTLILQALPAAWLAGRLGLLEREPPTRASPEPAGA